MNSLFSVFEWIRHSVFEAGCEGIGFDKNYDEIPLPTASERQGLTSLFQSAVSLVIGSGAVTDTPLAAVATADTTRLAPGALVQFLNKYSGEGRSVVNIYYVKRNILNFLSMEEVLKATSDLPSNSEHINDLLEYSTVTPLNDPRISVIDKLVWIKCFGEEALAELTFPQEPSMKTLSSMRSWAHLLSMYVEGDAGFTLLSRPRVTLNKLIALAAAPQAGHQPAVIQRICNDITAQHGDMPVEESVVAISNGVLFCSRGKWFEQHRDSVKGLGCQLPRMVDAVALCFLTYINSSATATSPVRLLNDAHRSYTSCIDQSTSQGNPNSLVVGNFSPVGLSVSYGHHVRGVGVCVQRKF